VNDGKEMRAFNKFLYGGGDEMKNEKSNNSNIKVNKIYFC
jgi:hypothetical protein